VYIEIDLKPALSEDVLDARLLREFSENNNKFVSVAVRSLVPSTLVDLVLSKSKINSKKKCAEVTKEERKNIIKTLKNLSFKVKKTRPIEEAVVTSGGVSVKNINPTTMESKLVKGLYFCGEVIDVDAFTGGFNLQIAFSTGYLAGNNA
jgi:predicted Rossmann fold flavoprotein